MLSIERFKNILHWKKSLPVGIHIAEEDTKRLEKDEERPLLANVYHEFVKEGQKFRENLLDTHRAFEKLDPNMEAASHNSDEYTLMISTFVSRDFGARLVINDEELHLINQRRQSDGWGHYVSKKEAIEVYGTSKPLNDKHTLLKYFYIGINKEGYWNYNHIALQIEDIYGILSIRFPGYEFCFLFDQSSGHGRMKEGSLNANLMNNVFGGKQSKLMDTKIKDLGPYHHILQIGDTQSMVFNEGSTSPFYIQEAHKKTYDQFSGKYKTSEKTKEQSISDFKEKGFKFNNHYSKEEIHQLTLDNGVELTFTKPVVIPGWIGKPKGLLQVLWERGWI